MPSLIFVQSQPDNHYIHWHRQLGAQFSEFCMPKQAPTHVWIAVSDDAISEFVEENFHLARRKNGLPL
jgi:hypothetical protein